LGLSEIGKLMEVLVGLRKGEARTEEDYLCARSADIYTLTRGVGCETLSSTDLFFWAKTALAFFSGPSATRTPSRPWPREGSPLTLKRDCS
jgi:hypothetical protein